MECGSQVCFLVVANKSEGSVGWNNRGSSLSWCGLRVKSVVRNYASYTPFVEFTQTKVVLRSQRVFMDLVL
jgi:hypothetical protein